MGISIVIRCKDDERVFRCIDSIDEKAEIIVVLNHNPDLQKRLEQKGIICCISPPSNLSIVSNIGFFASTTGKVIITDSDTVFLTGCINKINKALDNHKVARARLTFDVNNELPFSKVVAEARDYVNSLPLVYTPGIGVRKDLVRDIGNFLFNENVPFAVDADLDYRIKKAGIDVLFLQDALIQHSAEGIKHDIKAALRIGSGCRVSAETLSRIFNGSNPDMIGKHLKGVKFSHFPDLIRKKGIVVFLYQIIWDIHFYIGYNSQRVCSLKKG
ncbi:hypothetical protein FTO70_15945 [Methanosarcina sp. KYL-1]|uniref:glycosyltransferase n=1 Tax=Methanosarcina sp. KYL-1 TaxID=2602068 RepID=UPI0021007821|nr:hypothetical protein [Methanosarcina sp. KYL-1]MCQ1537139.1 hypothetical protein [Methanosarcina sp. KYL-1]